MYTSKTTKKILQAEETEGKKSHSAAHLIANIINRNTSVH